MTLWNRIIAFAREVKNPPKADEGKAKGYSMTSREDNFTWFSHRERAEMLLRFKHIYEQGGVVSEAIDTYPQTMFSNGYQFEGKDDSLTEMVKTWWKEQLIEFRFYDGTLDAFVFGDGFLEKVYNMKDELVGLIDRPAHTFHIVTDERGNIKKYVQTIPDEDNALKSKVISFDPREICRISFHRLGGSVYGISLIGRAYDDIIRDAKIAEATAESIFRHGFKKYHIKVGDGGPIDEDTMDGLEKKFEDINHRNEFITPANVEILNLDQGHLEGANTYHEYAVTRFSASIGVPEEKVGLGRGSTEATAKVRMEGFDSKVAAFQKILEVTINDLIGEFLGSRSLDPQAVTFYFNDVNPDDEKTKADWISKMMLSTPWDPFAVFKQRWVQEQFYDPDEYEEYQEDYDPIQPRSEEGTDEPAPKEKGKEEVT